MVFLAAVEPAVRATDGGVRHANDGVGRVLNLRVVTLFDTNVTGTSKDSSLHCSIPVLRRRSHRLDSMRSGKRVYVRLRTERGSEGLAFTPAEETRQRGL